MENNFNFNDLCFNVVSLDAQEDTSTNVDMELDLEDIAEYSLYLYLHNYSGVDLYDELDEDETPERVNEFDLDSSVVQVRVLEGNELAAEQEKLARFMTCK